jgi:hypothetical protein
MDRKKSRAFAVATAVTGAAFFIAAGWTNYSRSAREPGAIPDPSNFSPNYPYGDVIVSPVSMESSEESGILRSLFDVQIRKYAVKRLKPGLRVTYILELWEKGKPVKSLRRLNGPRPVDGTVAGLSYLWVAILPLNKSLTEADEIKVSLSGIDVGVMTTIDNPFKNANGYDTTRGFSSQNDLPLVSGRIIRHDLYDSTRYTVTDRTLFLRLETEPRAECSNPSN